MNSKKYTHLMRSYVPAVSMSVISYRLIMLLLILVRSYVSRTMIPGFTYPFMQYTHYDGIIAVIVACLVFNSTYKLFLKKRQNYYIVATLFVVALNPYKIVAHNYDELDLFRNMSTISDQNVDDFRFVEGIRMEGFVADASSSEEKLLFCNNDIQEIMPFHINGKEYNVYMTFKPKSWERVQDIIQRNLGNDVRFYLDNALEATSPIIAPLEDNLIVLPGIYSEEKAINISRRVSAYSE